MQGKILTISIVVLVAFPIVAVVFVLFGDRIIPAGKRLEYKTFTVEEHSEISNLYVNVPEDSGEGLYLRIGDLVKPLLEFNSADWEEAGFEKSKEGVYWKIGNRNLCKLDSSNRLIYLSIEGTSEICLGKTQEGPFVCLPATRKEFVAVFGKPEKVRYYYRRAQWF